MTFPAELPGRGRITSSAVDGSFAPSGQRHGVGVSPPYFYSDGIIPPTIGPFNSLERGSGVRSSMSRRRSWAAKGSVGNRDDPAARGRSSRKPTKDIVFGVLGVPDVFGGSDCTPGDSAAGGGAVAAGRRGGAAAA